MGLLELTLLRFLTFTLGLRGGIKFAASLLLRSDQELPLAGIDGIVIAFGQPSVERSFSRYFRDTTLAMPVVFTWLEALDLSAPPSPDQAVSHAPERRTE